MNKDTTRNEKQIWMLSAFIMMFAIMCMSAGVLAADKTFIVSTDANTYEPNTVVTVSGTMYDGTDPAADSSSVMLTLYNTTNSSITSNTGVTTSLNGIPLCDKKERTYTPEHIPIEAKKIKNGDSLIVTCFPFTRQYPFLQEDNRPLQTCQQ